MAYNSKKSNMFNTGELMVKWANIAEPDEYRGATSHQIIVYLDTPDGEALAKQIQDLAGADAHVNGVVAADHPRNKSGRPFAKFKSTVFTKQGEDRFGRVFDATGKDTENNPYAGDTVKLRLSGPVEVQNTGTFSYFLNAVQIWEKAPREGSGSPFAANPDAVADDPGFAPAPEATAAPAAPATPDTTGAGDIPF